MRKGKLLFSGRSGLIVVLLEVLFASWSISIGVKEELGGVAGHGEDRRGGRQMEILGWLLS